MKRLTMVALGVLLLTAPVVALDKAGGKRVWTTGTVTAVSAGSLTIKGKDGESTFAADGSTRVVATGASRKMAALNADKKPARLTDFVEVGADVAVEYREMGAPMRAATVTVRYTPPASSAKK